MAAFACVFPGQGSQSIGMMRALHDANGVVQALYEEASDTLGYDLWKITCEGPEEELNKTTVTQPALLAASVAAWEVFRRNVSESPRFLAGHSLGEYSALVASGAIAFADAVALVAKRGSLMQSAVPAGEGAMAAILGLTDDAVTALCDEHRGDDVLSAVNFNSPAQVVIAGKAAAVQRACDNAKAAGAKRAVLLPVSVPSHCALMEGAAASLGEYLESVQISEPEIPVVHNADVNICTTTDDIRKSLVNQLFMPVRWVESVRLMHSEGVAKFVEVGPGKVLSGLNKRTVKEASHLAVSDPESIEAVKAELQ